MAPGREQSTDQYEQAWQLYDNAVAESFFPLLKRERIKRHIYSTRNDARGDVVDYIEMFYNSKRRHGFNEMLSPVEYEERFTERLVSV